MLQKVGEQIQDLGRGLQHWVRSAGVALGVGIAYFLAAHLGLALLTATERVAVFWPASGIASGLLVALGRWARVPVAVAVIVSSVAAGLMSDRNVWSALAFGLCNAGEALLASWLFERWFGPASNLDSLRRVLGLFAAAGVATAIAAVGASGAMILFGPSTAKFLDVWKLWFAGDALGIVTVAPLFIGVAAAVRDAPPWHELLEGSLGVVAVTVTIGSLLAILSGPWSLIAPASLLFPLLLWLGYRCRPVFAAAAVFTIAAAIVWTTTNEFGRYGDPAQPIAIRVSAAQISMLGAALAALALAALFAERRQHEASIVASEARLRSILDAANVIAWDVDPARKTVHTAGPVWRLLNRPEGSEPPDFAGFVEGIHLEDRDRVMAQFWESVSTDAAYQLEFRLRLPGGAERWVISDGSIERDMCGRPLRVRGITRDVTARKQAEEKLQESERKLRELLGALPAAIYVTDAEGHITYCNQSAVDLWGVEPTLGKDRWCDFTEFHHADGTPMALADCPTEIALKQGRIVRGREVILQRKDGTRIPIIPCPTPLRDETGAIIGVVSMSIDITERKHAEEHLRMLVAELDHRVKNTLATISSVTSRTQEASDSVADFVAALDGRIKSMAATHQLLSNHHWKGILLSDLVGRELAPYAAHGNTEIDGPELTLKAEAAQAVSMVLHELTTNGAKHGALSNRGGRVSVRWHREMNVDADARLRIEWKESGGPAVQTPNRSGYGMEVIRDLLPYELDGTVDLAFASTGVRCCIDIPVSRY